MQCKTHPSTGPLAPAERLECLYGLVTPQKCPGKAIACLTYRGKMPVPGKRSLLLSGILEDLAKTAEKTHENKITKGKMKKKSLKLCKQCLSTMFLNTCQWFHLLVTQDETQFSNYVRTFPKVCLSSDISKCYAKASLC